MYRSGRARSLLLTVAVVAALAVQSAFAAEGSDTAVRATKNGEHQVTKSAGYLAWSQTPASRPRHSDVWAKPANGRAFKVNPSGTEAGIGSLQGNKLVFQQFGRTSNIKVMNLRTRRVRGLAKVNTRHWEFWPRAQDNWVLYGRILNGTRRQKLLLTNLRSGATRTLVTTRLSTYLLPGQVNGDYVVWTQVGDRGTGIAKVKRYRISTRDTVTVPRAGLYNWGGSVTPRGTVYFGRSGKRCGTRTGLYRWRPGAGATQIVNFPDGVDMGQSFVFTTAEGKIQVFHNRARCSGLPNSSNLYEFGDPFTVTLTVTKGGNRDGTVTGRSLDCGGDCTQDFEPGSRVTLTATPEAGARFDSWSDPNCGSEPTCTLTLTSDTTITASFRP